MSEPSASVISTCCLAVDFDPAELIHEMMGPRFSQAWSRGALGGWQDLLATLGDLLIYVLPPLAGCILADWRRYSLPRLVLVAAGLAFTLFYGFAGGTRNVSSTFTVRPIAQALTSYSVPKIELADA